MRLEQKYLQAKSRACDGQRCRARRWGEGRERGVAEPRPLPSPRKMAWVTGPPVEHASPAEHPLRACPWPSLWLEGSLFFPSHKPYASSFPWALGLQRSTGVGGGAEQTRKYWRCRPWRWPITLGTHAWWLRMAFGKPEFPAYSWMCECPHLAGEIPTSSALTGPPNQSLSSQWHLLLFSGPSDNTQDRAKIPIGPGAHDVRITGPACVHTTV